MVNEEIIKRMRYLQSFEPNFKTQEDIDEFSNLIDKMDLEQNPDYLPYLIEFLDDNCYIDGINETLLNDIEGFAGSYYVPYLLRSLKEQYKKAANQIKYLFWGIFNDSECFDALKKNINLADKETLLKVLQDIENDEPLPEHVKAIKELRELLDGDEHNK